MVISVFIDVEESKTIIGMVWAIMGRNEVFTVDRNKVGCPVDGIDVDNAVRALVPLIELWAHHPHPGIFVWIVSNTIEPVDNRTWIIAAIKVEREEGEDASNLQSIHRVCFQVCIDKDTVMPRSFISPVRTGANDFPTHAMRAANIAGCIEKCARRVEHLHWADILRIGMFGSIDQIVSITWLLFE